MAVNNFIISKKKLNMLEIYFKSNTNTEAAAHAYEEQLPERHQPNQRHFRFLVMNLLPYGSFVKAKFKIYTKQCLAFCKN
jgi:glucosamine 6-phosphate synthetase-like amidotransferase/phosphosugar isomerase protein